jgi:putative ABC transport system ATP-binding protein
MEALEISELGIRIRGRWLLRGVTLGLGPGTVLGLRGPSGIGKTTLLRTVAALLDPDAGELRLDGRSPADWGYPLWRRHVSYLAQRSVILPGTVEENLRRPFRYDAAQGPFDPARAEELLSRVGFEAGVIERDALALSEGERQRIAFVRTMLASPSVLLLDEPTSALDPQAMAAVEAIVGEHVRDFASAALVATHDQAQLDRFCERVVDMSAWARDNTEPYHG